MLERNVLEVKKYFNLKRLTSFKTKPYQQRGEFLSLISIILTQIPIHHFYNRIKSNLFFKDSYMLSFRQMF
jgi:hypothetical protein